MQTISLSNFLSDVRSRKRALGFDESPQAVEALRNKGANRTPAKRALLLRTKRRAIKAGLTPLISY